MTKDKVGNIKIDVVLDLAYGDSGKGKISHNLLSSGKYNFCLRFNGGGNAGHTIYHNGKKFVTHLIPAGVFYDDVTSVIGPGCVVNPEKLLEEYKMLQEQLGKEDLNVWIAQNTHIVTPEHLRQDSTDEKIGTTKTGNGPAYAEKYARTGIRVSSVPQLEDFSFSMFETFYNMKGMEYNVLAEGAQSVNLDIDWGNYPYVTSSHCGIGGLLNNGFNHNHIKNVYGVIKGYDTYVGKFDFEPKNNALFSQIRELGQEYGATTGRPRQVNWINVDVLRKGILMNGVTHLIVNKMDILDKVGKWAILEESSGTATEEKVVKEFSSAAQFENFITDFAVENGIDRNNVFFSRTADGSDLHFAI